MSDGQIVTVDARDLVSPAEVEKMIKASKTFDYFKSRVLTENDRCDIKGKIHVKKSGWLKYALACNLSLELREERVEDLEDRRIYHVTYRAIAPSGRYADAVGSAATNEKTFNHLDHDTRALAQTRASNRAISNLVGGGEVSAEEMEPPSTPTPNSEEDAYIVDREAILNAIEDAGLDSLALDIYPDGNRLVVKPREYLGDVWSNYNSTLRPLGATWRRLGKEGRWEISP